MESGSANKYLVYAFDQILFVIIGILLLSILSHHPLKAQNSSSPEVRNFESVEASNLMDISSIIQDQQGFFWIASESGLHRYDGYELTSFQIDMNDGKSSTDQSIKQIVDDPHAGLWILFHKGTLRYLDKKTGQFSRFPQDWPKEWAFPKSPIEAIFLDSKGGFWVGTRNDGLYYYDQSTGKIEHFAPSENDPFSISGDHIRSILEDQHQNLWVSVFPNDSSVTKKVLNRLSISTGKFEHFVHNPLDQHSLSAMNLTCIYEDHNGIIWVGTTNGGLNRLDPGTQKISHFIHNPKDPKSISWGRINVLFQDRQHNLWIGTNTGLSRLHYGADHFEHYLYETQNEVFSTEYQVQTIWEDYRRNLWIGGDFGLKRISEATENFNYIYLDPSDAVNPSFKERGPLIEDSSGKVWIGTGIGLFSINHTTGASNYFPYDSKPLQAYFSTKTPKPYYESSVNSILEGQDGTLWIAGSRIYRLERSTGKISPFIPFFFAGINDLLEDHQGNLWLGSNFGIESNVDPINHRFEHYHHFPDDSSSISSNLVSVLYEDSQHTIWVGTSSEGLNRMEFENGIRNWNSISSIPKDKILRTYPDAENIPTDAIKGPGYFSRFKHDLLNPFSVSNNRISDIFEDSRGRFWVGTTGGGLNLMDRNTGEFKYFKGEEPETFHNVFGIAEGSHDDLWLSTEKGITHFDPENKIFRHFNQHDGLPDRSLGAGIRSSRTGELLFHGGNGVLIFHPDSLRKDTILPPVKFTSFSWFDRKKEKKQTDFFITEKESIHLSWQDKMVSFEFASLGFYKSAKCQYRYRLDGLSDQWYELGNRREVSFASLQPGSYSLQIMGSNGDGVWNPHPAIIKIKVSPPWWQTWWAYSLYLLISFALIWGYIRWRTYSLRKRQKQLDQTIIERTAEVVAQKEAIQKEKERSEDLLLNILPAAVAKELMETGQTRPVHYEEVSILFADFKEFTSIVASIPPKRLIGELNDIFRHYDDIIVEEGLEKIKTIGDAYLAASGLPKEDPDHAIKCVRAAKRMIEFLHARNQKTGVKWKVRIGIHSGPITAGVIGKRKFAYDLFGDTINIASRIETASDEGRINVSAFTYDLIKDTYPCEYRGKINAKGKGDLDMYFVS